MIVSGQLRQDSPACPRPAARRQDPMRIRLLLPLLLAGAAAAAPAPSLQPGLWRFRNTPTAATLDGQPLADLPAPPITDEEVCLSPADAADPARWLARDTGANCTLTRSVVAHGLVDIAGTCPPAEDGAAPGTLRITGTATTTGYRLRFATVAHGTNGAMSFAGDMVGHRVGTCPAAP